MRALSCRRFLGIASLTAVLAMAAGIAVSLPVTSREGVLPLGSELNEEALDQPTELFDFELAGRKRSDRFNFGDMAFSSPAIFGGAARRAGISCNSCHQQGAGNARLFIPGLSSRPGTFDTTNALFNPKADNHVFDPVTPPSLRGAKHLAPYTHTGRFATLREFIHNAIVNEFAGPEPSEQLLDALVNYVEEIAFLPNAKLEDAGKLSAKASDAALRGEAVFNRPFPHDPQLSCAGCHQPSNYFVDNKLHDVKSGGTFKTPPLINANFNAPYFHDGRYDNYEQVVDHFDRTYALALTKAERADLVAYLTAVGDADTPFTRNTVAAEMEELANFVSVLETAIPAKNNEVIALAVESVGAEWREIGEHFPEEKNTAVEGGLPQRQRARLAVRQMVLSLRQIAMATKAGDYDRAASLFAAYKRDTVMVAGILQKAEPWSLFNPTVLEKHLAALRQLNALAAVQKPPHETR